MTEKPCIPLEAILNTAHELARKNPDRIVSCSEIQFALAGRAPRYHKPALTAHRIQQVLRRHGFVYVKPGRYQEMEKPEL
ncbi:MAG: hypothetical protein Q4Q04_05100 [Methanocorpusculum sp.]|nr:hypothetical protein [Methanocorpusculum sp.]